MTLPRVCFALALPLALASCVLQTETVPGPQGEPGAPSPWTVEDDAAIHYVTGPVGIGVTDPSNALQVGGTVEIGQMPAPALLAPGVGSDSDYSLLGGVNLSASNPQYHQLWSQWQVSPAIAAFDIFHRPPSDDGTPESILHVDAVTRDVDIDANLGISGQVNVSSPDSEARINLRGKAGENDYSATVYMYDDNATTYNHELAYFKAGYLPNDLGTGTFDLYTKNGDSWVQGVHVVNGAMGIGTASPQATLDINGTARLLPFQAAPFACSQERSGAIALTSKFTLCACKLDTWVETSNGTTTCTW